MAYAATPSPGADRKSRVPKNFELARLLRPNGGLAPRASRRLGEHLDERDVPAQLRHLVVDREALSRRQPRYMLERIVDVIGERHRRSLPPAAEVAVRARRATIPIERRGGTAKGRRRLVQKRDCCVRWACVRHGLGPWLGRGHSTTRLACTRFRRHLVKVLMEQEVGHGEATVYAGVQG